MVEDDGRAEAARGSRDLAPLRTVLPKLGALTLLAYGPLLVIPRIPVLDSTRPPYVDLESTWAHLWYWIAQSAGTAGAPIVVLAAIIVLVSRPGIRRRRRSTEAVLLALLALIGAGGGAAANEYLLKTRLQVPRPNIVALAGSDGTGPLGRSADDFYALGEKQVRSDSLRIVLQATPAPIGLLPIVLEHWVDETGYSLPSGHTFSALFIAVFFVGAALSLGARQRVRVLYPLLLWACLVGLSRPILRVHTPTDLAVGGALGIIASILALQALRAALDRSSRSATAGSG